MTLKDLKELSGKRLINISRLYKSAGLGVSSMHSRTTNQDGALSYDENRRLELAAIEVIEQVASTLSIDRNHLANALGYPAPDPDAVGKVEPMGYMETSERPVPVFKRADKILGRKMRSGAAPPEFWTTERILNSLVKNRRFHPTDRGMDLLRKQGIDPESLDETTEQEIPPLPPRDRH